MTRMSAILAQGGFMKDAQDGKQIYGADFPQRMARAIVRGFQDDKRAVETRLVASALPAPAH